MPDNPLDHGETTPPKSFTTEIVTAPGLAEPTHARQLDRTRQVGRNSMVGIACQVVVLFVGLFLTPYTLDHVGLTIFGLWSFILTAVSYIKLFNIGLGSMVTRFVATYYARGDIVLCARFLTFGVLATLALGIVVLPAAYFLIPILVAHLHLPGHLRHTALVVFYWGYAYFFATSIIGFFANGLIGAGSAWLASVLDVGTQIVYAAILVTLLARGSGIYALLIASSVGAVGGGLVTALICRHRLGRLFANPFAIERGLRRQVYNFSGWTQLNYLFSFLVLETDPFVLGTFVSIADVGIYSLAGRLAAQVSYLPRTPQNAIMAGAAGAHAQGDTRALHKVVIDGGRAMSLFGFSIAGVIIALGPVIYRAWLGRTYPALVPVMILLSLNQLVLNLGVPVEAVVVAMGEMRTFTRFIGLGAVANIAVTIALLIPFGFIGVVIGTLVGALISTAICLVRFHHLIHLPLRQGINTWLWRLILAAGVGVALLRVAIVLAPTAWTTSRGRALATLVVLTVVYLIVFAVGLRLTRYFRSSDLDLLRRVAPGRFAPMFDSQLVHRLLGVGE